MELNIYGIVSLIGFVITASMTVILSQSKKQYYTQSLTMLMLFLDIWLLAETLYYLLHNNSAKLIADAARYFGITYVPAATLLFIWHFYLQKDLPKWWKRILFVLPTLSIIVMLTNDFHNLFWAGRFVVFYQNIHYVRSLYGWYYLNIYLPSAYVYVGVGIVLLLMSAVKLKGFLRAQALLLIPCVMIPFAGNVLFFVLEENIAAIDYTPQLFVVTVTLMYLSMRKFGFLDILPEAHETIINNLADGVIILDKRHYILEANSIGLKLLGAKKHFDVQGEPIRPFLGSLGLQYDAFLHRKIDRTTVTVEEPKLKHFMLKDRALMNRRGLPVGRALVFQDITSLTETMESLRIAKDLAEEATDAKTRFLANVSHEIRTPMTAIIGTVDMLKNTDLSDTQNQNLQTIATSTQLLLQIVNDLLDLSKIEAGKFELVNRPFAMKQQMEEVEQIIRPMMLNRPIELITEYDDGMPDYVVGDNLRLKQVVINLLTNSVKYTDEGFIYCRLAIDEIVDQSVKFTITVEDTGIGIDTQHQLRLFDLFYQVDHSNTRGAHGAGLGLNLTQQLVDKMEGSIEFTSAVGVGTKFDLHFTLPFLTEEPVEKEVDLESLKKLNILIAEDNRMNREFLKLLFKKIGCDYTLVASGGDVVEAAKSADFDLLLMDINMPDMDGYEATQAIREHWYGKVPFPIVALTANDTDDDRSQARRAGMDGFMTKPFTYKKLAKTIGRLDILE